MSSQIKVTQMSLTPKARTALLASIEHYKQNIELLDADRLDEISIRGSDCALCAEFYPKDQDGRYCTKCPVFAYSAEPGCVGTPWENIEAEFLKFWAGESSAEGIRAALVAELEFLRSLLTD